MFHLPELKIVKIGQYTRLFLDGVHLPMITDYQIAEKADDKHCTLTVTMNIQKDFTCYCDTDESKDN